MKWYSYLICLICICLGIFSTISLVSIWSTSSGVYGSFIYESIETENDYGEVAKFDYGSIPFSTEDYSTYTSKEKFEHIDFDGNEHDYVLLFNDNLCSDLQISSGKIFGKVSLNFYSTEGVLASTATLDILIEFFDVNTIFTITTTNNNSSIAYLNLYMNTNGACFKLLERC